MGEARTWDRTGYIAVPLEVEPAVVSLFLKDLNVALRLWYLEKLDQTRAMHQKYPKPKHPKGSVERVRAYLDRQMRTWDARPPLPVLHDIWNLPDDWICEDDDKKLVQHARQGAMISAQGQTCNAMVKSGFGFISHMYGLNFVWALLPAVFDALRAYASGSVTDRLHLTGLPHLIIKPPRTGAETKLAAHVDGGSLKTMLERCRDVLSDTEPTVDTWVRKFGFQSLVHIVGSNGHTSILGPMTVARYALVLSMVQNPFNEAVLPESDEDWLRHPDMETCFDLGRGGSVKDLSSIVDAFIARLSKSRGKRKSIEGSATASASADAEPESDSKKLITAEAAAKVIAALRTLYDADADVDAKTREFRTACRAHIGTDVGPDVAGPKSARSATYVVRKYLTEDLDSKCRWSQETPPNFCDILYNTQCIAVLNRVLRAVVTGTVTAGVDAVWIRKWQSTDIGGRATAVLREDAARFGSEELGVIPITTGGLDHLPYIAMWPDGFIHGSNAMETGPRVSITVPVATASRLDEPWALSIGRETHRERIRRGIERIDALARGDFEAVRRERAVYATGSTHTKPHLEADDARHFTSDEARLYVTGEDWPSLKGAMYENAILPRETRFI